MRCSKQSLRMLIFVAVREAPMKSVVAPALLSSIRHHQQFSRDQSSRTADGVGGRAGNLPHGPFLRHVPADFDHVAGFQEIRWHASSVELKRRWTFDRPALTHSIRVCLFQENEAMGE